MFSLLSKLIVENDPSLDSLFSLLSSKEEVTLLSLSLESVKSKEPGFSCSPKELSGCSPKELSDDS